MDKFQESLPVRLTDEEIRAAADVLADKLAEVDSIEDEKKAVMTMFKSRMEEAQGEIAQAARLVREKHAMRMVECEEHPNFDGGTVDVVRLDTGEIVRSRMMTESERQQKLFEVGSSRKN